jgi:hypothetical protein
MTSRATALTRAQRRFLDAFRNTATISAAARVARVGRRTHYNWLDRDDAYADAFDEAREDAADALEEEARRRALEGVEVPLIGRVGKDQDGIVTTIRKYSDTLLIALLNANRPEKFRYRAEITGKDGGPIKVESEVARVDLTKLTDEQLDQLEAIHAASGSRPATSPARRNRSNRN